MKSPLDMFYHWEATIPDKIYLRQPINGQWKTWTWKQAGQEARRMATVIKAMNLPAESKIALVSKNCAHWMICDLAIMMSGHVSVPLYPNTTDDTMLQVLEHSEARLLFVGKLDDWPSMEPGVPAGMKCISFPFCGHPEYDQWYDLIEDVEPMGENSSRPIDELCTIVYTSGTTGKPKGVMHTFAGFAFATPNAGKFAGLGNEERFFSYLPLAHVAERMVVEMGSLYYGATIFFAESLETFTKNVREAKPTVFFGVPRIWKKFQSGILEKLPQHKLDFLLRIPVLSSLIKKKIRQGLGLESARIILTGASPMPVELFRWYVRIGIPISEAYGMTENLAYSHLTSPGSRKFGTLGSGLPGSEWRLGENNEVQVKNPAIMPGYYKEPELTSEMFTPDGFLKTGDEGLVDEDGDLRIIGRTKDLFKTSKGKYVAPSPIEMKIGACSHIEYCCVVGAGLHQPIALVTLSATGRQLDKKMLGTDLEIMLAELNPALDAHERIGKIIAMQEDWSIDNGLLTPTLKIKRFEIEKRYSARFEAWLQNTDLFQIEIP
ncbi:AMP-binding protein [Flavihumibacter stibioxidans]|uniref:AMP-binding protein n=2 Tax=Flavihumibacter stibioxidans TaxID=1834163 RepID=A0ABR7MC15_9BACT|nr:AMP-binding protein [Flavihumibacter stibioxidans]